MKHHSTNLRVTFPFSSLVKETRIITRERIYSTGRNEMKRLSLSYRWLFSAFTLGDIPAIQQTAKKREGQIPPLSTRVPALTRGTRDFSPANARSN